MPNNPVHILLVEDEKAHVELIRSGRMPAGRQMAITAVATLAEAQDALKQITPDIIVTDLRLPDGVGTDLLQSTQNNGTCPLVVMTSYGDEESAVATLKAGAFDYIVKSELTLLDMFHTVDRVLREWSHVLERRRTEEALRASEERYHTLFDSANIGIVMLKNEIVTDCNQKMAEILRTTRDGILNRALFDFMAETQTDGSNSVNRVREIMEKVNTERLQVFEWTFRDSGGNAVYTEISLSTVKVKEELFYLGFLRDVTARKQAERKLKDREDLLHNIVSNIPGFVFWKDRESFYTGCNSAFAKLFGCVNSDEIVGKTDFDLYDDQNDAHFTRACDKKVIDSGRPLVNIEEMISVPGGKRYRVQTSKVPLFDETGTVIGVLGICSDVTNLRMMMTELRDSKNLLQSIFDAIPDLLTVQDRERNIVMSNWKGCDHLSETARMQGRKCYELYRNRLEPCDPCTIVKVFETGERVRVEIFGDFDGRLREVNAFPIYDDYGSIVMVGEYVRDITDQRRLERQLVQTEKLSSIGQLVAGITHELNNKLTGMLGYAQLLQGTSLDEKQQKFRRIIEYEALQSKTIIESLLAFSRPADSGEKTYQSIAITIQGLLDIMVYKVKASNIKITSEIPEGLPLIKMNANQIEQVLLNVVNNALDALSDVGGFIHITCYERDPVLIIEVTDNGPGIPTNYIDNVFDPFFTTKAVGKGTGLGLSVSYGIVKEHGGNIRAENIENGGVKFTIELPIHGVEGG